MSHNKWCSTCKKVVTSNSIPNYCAWCGKPLKSEPLLYFKDWNDKCQQIAKLIELSNKSTITQLSLF